MSLRFISLFAIYCSKIENKRVYCKQYPNVFCLIKSYEHLILSKFMWSIRFRSDLAPPGKSQATHTKGPFSTSRSDSSGYQYTYVRGEIEPCEVHQPQVPRRLYRIK
uniref:Secreted protein n=1 Tax=Steinernema glaseri TaxID=37863 RepID=A0A1I7Z7P4_9BILA